MKDEHLDRLHADELIHQATLEAERAIDALDELDEHEKNELMYDEEWR